MTAEAIHVTWLVADQATDESTIEAWCRSAAADTADGQLFLQIATGRGQLVGGRGALVVDRAGGSPDAPAWCTKVVQAAFRLRQVNAPNEPPDLAATPAMLLTRTYVPDDMRDEFRDWLAAEHSQRQLDVPGNHWYLGYEEVGPRHSFMNFWGIEHPGIADGDAWDRQRLTPWRERMVPAMDGMDRAFYRPVVSVRA